MTCHAVVRRLNYNVALDAKTHRVTDHTQGVGHVPDFAVTRGAIDIIADVRSVIETNVRDRGKSVHPLPWNIFLLVLVVGNLLQFRLVGRHVLMTLPTFIDGGNLSHWACSHTLMAIHAVQFDLKHVYGVRVFDPAGLQFRTGY